MEIEKAAEPEGKDRMASTIVSFILSLFTIFTFLIYLPVVLFAEPEFRYIFFWGLIFYSFSIISVILGLFARNSTKCRGFAIAGVTISAPVFIIFTYIVFDYLVE